MAEQDPHSQNLEIEYSQVCDNFRLLTDIRFKLLTIMPIGTGTGLALTIGKPQISIVVGLFGLAVTAGVALYNLRNDQLYNELVGRAAQLERMMNLKDGAFAQRPRAWLSIGPLKVDHAKIWWVYLSSLSAWLFLILHGARWPSPPAHWLSGPPELIRAFIAILVVLLIASLIRSQKIRTEKRLRAAARGAVDALLCIPLASSPQKDKLWPTLLTHASELAGRKPEEVERTLDFYLQDKSNEY